jgi:hypothetical protein
MGKSRMTPAANSGDCDRMSANRQRTLGFICRMPGLQLFRRSMGPDVSS